MNETMKDLLRKLSEPCSVAGHAGEASRLLTKLLQPLCTTVETDAFGSVIGVKEGTSGKTVLLDAHLDEIALQVKRIRSDGALEFVPIGGIDPAILPGCEVIVHGKRDLFGVIGAKPPHLMKAEEGSVALGFEDLTVDVGMSDPNELVTVGDVITFLPVFREMSGGSVCCKGLDNKCGVAVMLYALERLQRCPHTVIFVASAAEEVGCLGAAAVMNRCYADFAIVTDVTFGMSPNEDEALCFPLGSGTAICTGPNISPAGEKKAISLARALKIPYSVEVEGGDTGTNAGVIQLSGLGVPTVLLSVPLRYMHTMSEIVDLSDMKATADLIVALAGGELPC